MEAAKENSKEQVAPAEHAALRDKARGVEMLKHQEHVKGLEGHEEPIPQEGSMQFQFDVAGHPATIQIAEELGISPKELTKRLKENMKNRAGWDVSGGREVMFQTLREVHPDLIKALIPVQEYDFKDADLVTARNVPIKREWNVGGVKYKVGEHVGSGTQGDVYEMFPLDGNGDIDKTKDKIALKILKTYEAGEMLTDESMVLREVLVNEALRPQLDEDGNPTSPIAKELLRSQTQKLKSEIKALKLAEGASEEDAEKAAVAESVEALHFGLRDMPQSFGAEQIWSKNNKGDEVRAIAVMTEFVTGKSLDTLHGEQMEAARDEYREIQELLEDAEESGWSEDEVEQAIEANRESRIDQLNRLSQSIDMYSTGLQTIIALHMDGIFHRDIKDENMILSDKDHKVKLLDPGIATAERFEDRAFITSDEDRTKYDVMIQQLDQFYRLVEEKGSFGTKNGEPIPIRGLGRNDEWIITGTVDRLPSLFEKGITDKERAERFKSLSSDVSELSGKYEAILSTLGEIVIKAPDAQPDVFTVGTPKTASPEQIKSTTQGIELTDEQKAAADLYSLGIVAGENAGLLLVQDYSSLILNLQKRMESVGDGLDTQATNTHWIDSELDGSEREWFGDSFEAIKMRSRRSESKATQAYMDLLKSTTRYESGDRPDEFEVFMKLQEIRLEIDAERQALGEEFRQHEVDKSAKVLLESAQKMAERMVRKNNGEVFVEPKEEPEPEPELEPQGMTGRFKTVLSGLFRKPRK